MQEQLVSYYYLWKKTPEATKPKQAARRVNPTSIKRPTKEKVKASRPTSTEYLDFDSASESDVENNGPSGRACHHCYGAGLFIIFKQIRILKQIIVDYLFNFRKQRLASR